MLWSLLLQTPAFPKVSPELALGHIRVLASDAMKGRGTPSPELDKAAEYIAAQFKAAKLEPLGDGKTYLLKNEYQGVPVYNVIGVLPGTDPALKDTYLLLTAHYDHLGERKTGDDTIYNGANDNASGVAGVIEVAKGMAKGPKPKRSVIFMTFWGEEKGLRGARAFVEKPAVPLNKIFGMVNLEQIGRTDDSEGPRVNEFNVTGFELSDLAPRLVRAAEPLKVKVTAHPKNSIPYFSRSDNGAFAGAGVIAHTISTAYSFPDYHGVDDEIEKINAPHLAQMIQAIGAGIRALANDPKPLKWAEIDAAKRYRDKAATLGGG